MRACDASDLESGTADENDHYLTTDHDGVDADEEVVLENAFEDIEFVVQTAVVEFIEDLHPDEGVEDYGIQLLAENAIVGVEIVV